MRKRPVGISILAILIIIGGMFSIIIRFYTSLRLSFTISIVTIASALFYLALTTLVGVTLWRGKKWGWWLGTSYLAYFILSYIHRALTLFVLHNQQISIPMGLSYELTKISINLIMNILIYLYLFKDNVMEYYGVNRESKLKYGLIVLGIGILLIAMLISIRNHLYYMGMY